MKQNLDLKYVMGIAIGESRKGYKANDGGPFGAVIIDKQGNIIAASHNHVLCKNNPTCHAEIETIREACEKLGTHDLSGYILITSCQPCPMCLCAIAKVGIKIFYYGCTKEDAGQIGFRDDMMYEYFADMSKSEILNVIQSTKYQDTLSNCDNSDCLILDQTGGEVPIILSAKKHSDNFPFGVAEIEAITDAGDKRKTFDLSGCVMYCKQKPSMLAMAAAIWANIKEIYYMEEKNCFTEIDKKLLRYFRTLNPLEIFNIVSQIEHDECCKVFEEYLEEDKQRY